MDVASAVLVTLLGSAGLVGAVNALSQMSRPARLRAAIARDLELAEKLPEGSSARAALVVVAQSAAIDLAVHALERRRHTAIVLYLLGIGAVLASVGFWSLLGPALDDARPPQTPPTRGEVMLLIVVGFGLWFAAIAAALPDHRRRRDRRRAILSRDPSAWALPRTDPAPTLLEVYADTLVPTSLLEDLLPPLGRRRKRIRESATRQDPGK
jgi:hypothetical protein